MSEPIPTEVVRREREQIADWIERSGRAIDITKSVVESVTEQLNVVGGELTKLIENHERIIKELRK